MKLASYIPSHDHTMPDTFHIYACTEDQKIEKIQVKRTMYGWNVDDEKLLLVNTTSLIGFTAILTTAHIGSHHISSYPEGRQQVAQSWGHISLAQCSNDILQKPDSVYNIHV